MDEFLPGVCLRGHVRKEDVSMNGFGDAFLLMRRNGGTEKEISRFPFLFQSPLF